jgi:cytochrome P450
VSSVPQFDHTTEHHARTWRETFAQVRQTCPVLHSDNHGGYHVVTRHADVMAVLADPESFSSERSWDENGNDVHLGATIPPTPVRVGFLDMDPPGHTAYRKPLNGWFTRQAVTRGRARIAQIARWAVDQVIEQGGCDVVFELASPFQVVMFLDLVGIPIERWPEFARIAHKIHGSTDPADRPEGLRWLHDELEAEIVRQRAAPSDGLLGQIATTEIEGQLLPLDTATELAVMLLLGGELTTIATICHFLDYLYRHPGERKRLRADRSAMPAAVDEILRYFSPSVGIARTVTRPATLSGQELRPGDRLLLSYASANLDESVFEQADQVDLCRRPNPHLAFGKGIHRCIGAQLAHTNVELLISEVLERMPDYVVTSSDRFERIPTVNAFHNMRIEYAPAPRSAGAASSRVPVLTEERVRPTAGS